MICISIAQESRRLALVDMLNAAQLGADLIEVRLDFFEKDPQFSDLLSARRKPVIFTCRRTKDGGRWDGSEDERLMLLRQAVMAKADYVEIELDVADQIRPFPGCQRVISYTNLRETPHTIGDIYEEAQQQKPDVIKLTCGARTPEEAWPLLQLLIKPPVPTVVVGLGRPGVLLAILGRKIGAPWTYAALERGAEAYPGQPTMSDLIDVYHYRGIERNTRFIGVIGLDEQAFVTTAGLNATLASLGLPARCLPLQVGSAKLFRKIAEAVRVAGIVVDPLHYATSTELVDAEAEPSAQEATAADLLLKRDDGWQAGNVFGKAVLHTLETVLRSREGASAEPLKGCVAMFAGADARLRMLAPLFKEAGGVPIFACPDRDAAQRLAVKFGGRFVPWEALYSTLHDVLIVGGMPLRPGSEDEAEAGGPPDIHPGYLRPSMTVLDLTALPRRSVLLNEAVARGCTIVEPLTLLGEHLSRLTKRLTGQQAQNEPWRPVLEQHVVEDA